MRISIDERSPEPVFAQLIAQIRDAVRRGDLRPGVPLPAIRQLAADLQLNPNTVAKAYRLLDRDGVIETRGRRGSFVHQEGRRHSKVDLGSRATKVLETAIETLRETGLTDAEIRGAFTGVMKGSR